MYAPKVIAEGKFGVLSEVYSAGGVWNLVRIDYEDGTKNSDNKDGYLRLHMTPVYLTTSPNTSSN